MRRWNLDELPQFWNVFKGEMSLVGPRPERPYHVDRLAEEIPHYMPRHLVKPGMTGWAQVHGLRGETDLAQRIQYDITYIENWTPILDLQIILMTFLRWRDDSFQATTPSPFKGKFRAEKGRRQSGTERSTGRPRPLAERN